MDLDIQADTPRAQTGGYKGNSHKPANLFSMSRQARGPICWLYGTCWQESSLFLILAVGNRGFTALQKSQLRLILQTCPPYFSVLYSILIKIRYKREKRYLVKPSHAHKPGTVAINTNYRCQTLSQSNYFDLLIAAPYTL